MEVENNLFTEENCNPKNITKRTILFHLHDYFKECPPTDCGLSASVGVGLGICERFATDGDF